MRLGDPVHQVLDIGSKIDGPPQIVLNLAPAEREIALLVYQLGGCTAKEVQDRLDKRVTNREPPLCRALQDVRLRPGDHHGICPAERDPSSRAAAFCRLVAPTGRYPG
jgi:hypothetical protein